MIFVFGSNRAGRHGKGAALFALKRRGAIYGKGEGWQGDSYAIPTKDADLRTLPLSEIRYHVDKFLSFARDSPDLVFEVTPIGCGLAGYKPEDIAPLFIGAPENCILPELFRDALTLLQIKHALEDLYSDEAAARWLNSPQAIFDGKSPFAMIEGGEAEAVLRALGAISRKPLSRGSGSAPSNRSRRPFLPADPARRPRS